MCAYGSPRKSPPLPATPRHSVLPATRALARLAAGFLVAAAGLLVLAWLGVVEVEFFHLAFACGLLVATFTIMPGGIMESEVASSSPPLGFRLPLPSNTDFKSRCCTPAAPPPRTPHAI